MPASAATVSGQNILGGVLLLENQGLYSIKPIWKSPFREFGLCVGSCVNSTYILWYFWRGLWGCGARRAYACHRQTQSFQGRRQWRVSLVK